MFLKRTKNNSQIYNDAFIIIIITTTDLVFYWNAMLPN